MPTIVFGTRPTSNAWTLASNNATGCQEKFSVAPVSSALQAFTGQEIDASKDEDAIRHTLQQDMAQTHGKWEFRVQLCRDLEAQPVEGPTKQWDETEAPFLTVATIEAMPQDSWEPGLVDQVDEKMRFNIWTGLAAHQPLGNINRARNQTYKHSSEFRANFNRCPKHEPG